MADAVVAAGLRKSFDDFEAVKGIDFRIRRGECYGFLGPNGAGKTTTMRMIYRATTVGSGQLSVLDYDAADEDSDRDIKSKLGVVPQLDNLDTELTVRENLAVFCRFYKLSKAATKKRIDELIDFANLREKEHVKTIALSGGMRRRLLVARGLINEPELVVLDEPTTGLDPRAREALWEQLAILKERGVTLILTTHYMREAERLCDRLAIMDQGEIVGFGSPDELISENVPPNVVEVVTTDDATRDALKEIGELALNTDTLRDRTLIYCDDPEGVMHRVSELTENAIALMRPSTLEDVFLAITGKGLE